MFVGIDKLEVNCNPKILCSIDDFLKANEEYLNFKKDTYFSRIIGFEKENEYLTEIQNMDICLLENAKKDDTKYLRLCRLDNFIEAKDLEMFSCIYENWKNIDKSDNNAIIKIKFPFVFRNNLLESSLKCAYASSIDMHKQITKNCSDTMQRNFAIKLLHWINQYLPKLFLNTESIGKFPKVVFYGQVKEHEYIFLYFLTRLGCDVLYLNTLKDAEISDVLKSYSSLHKNSLFADIKIPAYDVTAPMPSISSQMAKECETVTLVNVEKETEKEIKKEIKKDGKIKKDNVSKRDRVPININIANANINTGEKELNYEELASLAASIVMIKVFDEKQEPFKTGSGVLINKNGYIVTNCHVIAGGEYYSVRFEEQEGIDFPATLVKYNQLNDLAVLKVEVTGSPIPIYQGDKKLSRGQKVVAIGSPLGLFNSVSDGIISGFRSFDDVSMIQFTAPISHGSSGGAVLDLHGRLIGISTSGMDDGQNLNLAVDYTTVLNFVRGFI